ncbi:MAG: bifunctional diaminohydroxyphosphoribosylaminopyrimidine deaminase/5-amino-6-(5-phosphoribosylamino)uracil reductase RibD [Sphingobacterium sp.]|uniref:bifunctional diaminohydroxyphosphoribosylaminopyrimidine deaminase/5-amino-6-(5-phosphoribosylamino)uracil reductase RibD n=1 Tax=Sphingobacterium sp. JB170 TaxID=1434842 RepID=UPI00097EC1C1|nr:bifunctional diaminohydroxyphosphoribosylaminopyrimidine deaminase/5-amino-6-(5-phosphoribosylamino)uracil reductase RibD [Sphingobacterium sp. JB170]SJN45220.1 Diaminohydroxyphosphoribosylaminopyrimidine deaminase / 5-amino-6-(5-phosphoribosylamino)uracil reductase [Sphingobacterium sp. JB170]
MDYEERYMRRCLDLAVLGAGSVSPNPMVGAVVVYDRRVIGEGFTSPYGGPHAEVNAVNAVLEKYGESESRKLFKLSTIYVSLEPCSHQGKTPPCADMLIDYGFQKVVIGCLDPFISVNGRGLEKLHLAGIETKVGVLGKQCEFINRRFFTHIKQQRPFVILKWAETADGYFAPLHNSQHWISNAASKQLSHKWRSEEDSILIGTSTALNDNPSLTTREWKGKNPRRILIDKDLKVPASAAVLDRSAETIVFNAIESDWRTNIKRIALENFEFYLPQTILYQLYLMDIQSIIIEGGIQTLQSFIDVDLWDEARVFVSQQHWGEGRKSPSFQGGNVMKYKVGNDMLRLYYNERY